MNAAMKSPVFHQGSLFVIRGFEVLLYGITGTDIRYIDAFPFPMPVESIESRDGLGLVVLTTEYRYLIAGGPSLTMYYTISYGPKFEFVPDNDPMIPSGAAMVRR